MIPMVKSQIRKSFAIGTLAFITIISGCGNRKENPTGKTTDKYCLPDELNQKIKYETTQPAAENDRLSLTGKVEYNPDKLYSFVPLLDGVVERVHFGLGDYVAKGQVMLEIRSTELSSLNALQKSAQAELKTALRQLEAVEEMYKSNISSEKELIEAQRDVELARLEIAKVQDNLSIYGGNLEKGVLVVRAPQSGHVVDKKVVAGQQIESGAHPLFVISDLKEVWIMANVYPGNLENIQEGMKATIKVSAYPNQVFEGKIDKLSNVFDVEERVLKARIKIDNSGLKLKPEMFVVVSVEQPRKNKLYRIPAKAVIFNDQKYHVIVYHDPCNLEVKVLDPVYQTSSSMMVEDGILAGDKIITENHLLIYNQLRNY
jgi:cobalt-zinc-cadmium efflux system membrane fusion protein